MSHVETSLGDRVIIEVTEAAEETVGGVLLAASKEKPVMEAESLPWVRDTSTNDKGRSTQLTVNR